MSEVALDARLHYDHDLPVRQVLDEGRVIRYRDNLFHLARSLERCQEAEEVTKGGMSSLGAQLKPEEPGHGVFDLEAGASVPVLGLVVSLSTSRSGRRTARYELPDGWQKKLHEDIEKSFQTANPVKFARSVTEAWITWAAPVHRKRAELQSAIADALTDSGLPEIPLSSFKEAFTSARKR